MWFLSLSLSLFTCPGSSPLSSPSQRLALESAKLSETIVVCTAEKEHHFSLFANPRETFDLLEQLTKIAIME